MMDPWHPGNPWFPHQKVRSLASRTEDADIGFRRHLTLRSVPPTIYADLSRSSGNQTCLEGIGALKMRIEEGRRLSASTVLRDHRGRWQVSRIHCAGKSDATTLSGRADF